MNADEIQDEDEEPVNENEDATLEVNPSTLRMTQTQMLELKVWKNLKTTIKTNYGPTSFAYPSTLSRRLFD
jgi:hypothetical protein